MQRFLHKVNGWQVAVASSITEGVETIQTGLDPDVVVMDTALVHQSLEAGVQEILAASPDTDIIVTSASTLSSPPDHVCAVINKPFRLFDLSDVVRKRVEARRLKGITLADLKALVAGTSNFDNVSLTRRETQILGELVANVGETVSRSYLSEVYAEDEYIIDDRRWDNHVSGLRRKLKQIDGWTESSFQIKSARSIGYKLTT